MDRHKAAMPTARAINVFARTLHRQLRRSGYDRAELVGLVNVLLDLVIADAAADEAPLSGISDPETSLANAEAFLDAVEHEMRRACSTAAPLLMIVLDVTPPEWCSDLAVWGLQMRVAERLPRAVRPFDTMGRLGAGRFGLLLPGATLDHAGTILQRLIQPILSPRRSEDRPPEGTTVTVRLHALPVGIASAQEYLDACLAQPPHPFSAASESWRPPTLKPEPLAPSSSDGRAYMLALGGGAARAGAHIGVLRALIAANVEVEGIAGTSAGAIVGAMYLTGQTPDEILERFVRFTRSETYSRMRRRYRAFRRNADITRGVANLFRHTGVPLLSTLETSVVDADLYSEFITFFVGPDRDISTLDKPFAAVATDLAAGRPVWIRRGPLHAALRASCALPGVFPPELDGDRVYVDGSVLAEVPVAAARAIRADVPVLAVHLARPERDPGPLRSSAEIVIRASAMAHRELVREQLEGVEELLTAQVQDVGWLDFRGAAQTCAIGEEAARTFLAKARQRP